MKTYRSFAKTLDELLRSDEAVRLTVPGYMPLSIERIARSGMGPGPTEGTPNGREQIALSHTAVQNGDLMRDPELVFAIYEAPAEPRPGTQRITRAEWSRKHRDFKGKLDGQPSMLALDPETGATVLTQVTIVDRFAEPVSFRNDFLGILQEVYDYDERGQRSAVRPRLKAELRSFARTWFRNLEEQGFLAQDPAREVLA